MRYDPNWLFEDRWRTSKVANVATRFTTDERASRVWEINDAASRMAEVSLAPFQFQAAQYFGQHIATMRLVVMTVKLPARSGMKSASSYYQRRTTLSMLPKR
jgi:hypothetical protein